MMGVPKVITLVMTGASGAQYGLRLLEMLIKKTFALICSCRVQGSLSLIWKPN